MQPPLILAESVLAEQYKQALMENRRLKEKEQDAQMELYQAKADKLNLTHQQLKEKITPLPECSESELLIDQ